MKVGQLTVPLIIQDRDLEPRVFHNIIDLTLSNLKPIPFKDCEKYNMVIYDGGLGIKLLKFIDK